MSNEHVTELRKMIGALWATDTPPDARMVMQERLDALARQLAEAEERCQLRENQLHFYGIDLWNDDADFPIAGDAADDR